MVPWHNHTVQPRSQSSHTLPSAACPKKGSAYPASLLCGKTNYLLDKSLQCPGSMSGNSYLRALAALLLLTGIVLEAQGGHEDCPDVGVGLNRNPGNPSGTTTTTL